MAWNLYQNTNLLATYNEEKGAFNALLELTSIQFTGPDKPREPTGEFIWERDCTTDKTVRVQFDTDAFYSVVYNEHVYTTDGYDVVDGDIRTGNPVEVVYPHISVERAKKLKTVIISTHIEHTSAATAWIQGWREAQFEYPNGTCPFMKTVEELPAVRTCLALTAHLNTMRKDLKWMSENPPGIPEPEPNVIKAKKWQLRAPGFYRKIDPNSVQNQ